MSQKALVRNPFPGPQPYRAADKSRFFGREAVTKKLANQILAHPCTALFGPSGAGKSSLMQAGVIPYLEDAHDFRVVRLDAWPPGEKPFPWLVRGLFGELRLGPVPQESGAETTIDEAMARARRRSDQPILIYADQLEQLLGPERDTADVQELLAAFEHLAKAPVFGLTLVLSLREDYLGRFRDRARDRRVLLAQGFRLGPLTVGEMVSAVCRAAAEGEPPQRWDEAETRALMREVQGPGQAPTDEAEVQAAYAQIVCRALFQERAEGRVETAIEAEAILRRYMDTMLDSLGDLKSDARLILEEHLITANGSRTLRKENELLLVLPSNKLTPILRALEGAAILHAEAHEGSRYFEIGHDWLASEVHERRQKREREEEQARRDQEQQAALLRAREEADAELEKARKDRRSLWTFATLAGAIALFMIVLAIVAILGAVKAEQARKQAAEAETRANDGEKEAKKQRDIAGDARLLAGFRELKGRGELAWGTKLLVDMKSWPSPPRGLIDLASDALARSALTVTLRGHQGALTSAVWSRDGKKVLTAAADGTAALWDASGNGDPLVLYPDGVKVPHPGKVELAVLSPDDSLVLLALEDGTVRLLPEGGKGKPFVLDGHAGSVLSASFSPDGRYVLLASRGSPSARLWNVGESSAGAGSVVSLDGHTAPLTMAVFASDGSGSGDLLALTASEDKTARIFRLFPKKTGSATSPTVFRGHGDVVLFAAANKDGTRIVTTSRDGSARLWNASGNGETRSLTGHTGPVVHAAFSDDGKYVATASKDRTARIFQVDGKGEPVVLAGHTGPLTFVAFRPDGRYVVTASDDQTARIWPVSGGEARVLGGHGAPVRAAMYGPDGSQLLTFAADESGRLVDSAARIWAPKDLAALRRPSHPFFHSACIGPDGMLVVSAYDDGKARLWHLDDAGERVVLPPVFEGHSGWIASAALSNDGKRVVTTSFDGTVRVSDISGTGETLPLEGDFHPVRAAVFSPNGNRVVTASEDGTARVHYLYGNDAPVLLGKDPQSAHADALTSVAWEPQGERIVTTSLDHTARIWRADGASKPILLGHRGEVYWAAWSADAGTGPRWLVTASDDGSRMWDADTGRLLRELDRGEAVSRAITSPSGDVATALQNGGVHVFRNGASEPIVLETPAPVLGMAFRDGGGTLFAVLSDDTVRTWTLDARALYDGLLDTNKDCLPVPMRVTYMGEDASTAQANFERCEAWRRRGPLAAMKGGAR